ncbi:hypothetical protein BV22DRAFT_642676 [Leucogyrophana mollusca]|uniref:Uncharacterized protein n=1 Tax=Leucogyrophana mollusca TaxID=85980 RepID=A0ACB8BCY3_9AGAM|nr:hypothetical protein BV22DRAFT_642676 [Leucogyrophana mollusca]
MYLSLTHTSVALFGAVAITSRPTGRYHRISSAENAARLGVSGLVLGLVLNHNMPAYRQRELAAPTRGKDADYVVMSRTKQLFAQL